MGEIFEAISAEAQACLVEAGKVFSGSWEETLNARRLGGLPQAVAKYLYRAEYALSSGDPVFCNSAAAAGWLVLAAGEIAAFRGDSMDAAYARVRGQFAALGVTPDYAGAGPCPWPSVGPSSPAG